MDFSVFAIFDETLCIFRMHDVFFHPPFLALCGAAPRSEYSSTLKRAPARSSALPRAPAHSSALALRSVSHARAPREAKRARICQWERWRSTECRGYLVGAGPMPRQQGAKGDQLGESGRCSEISVAVLMFAAVG